MCGIVEVEDQLAYLGSVIHRSAKSEAEVEGVPYEHCHCLSRVDEVSLSSTGPVSPALHEP